MNADAGYSLRGSVGPGSPLRTEIVLCKHSIVFGARCVRRSAPAAQHFEGTIRRRDDTSKNDAEPRASSLCTNSALTLGLAATAARAEWTVRCAPKVLGPGDGSSGSAAECGVSGRNRKAKYCARTVLLPIGERLLSARCPRGYRKAKYCARTNAVHLRSFAAAFFQLLRVEWSLVARG